MGRLNKIEHMGLASRIIELVKSGVTRSGDIAEQITREGHRVSQPTVSRWLKEQREKQKSDTQKLVSDHVLKVIPVDLHALEEMELQCLERSRETKGDFSHRLAEQYIDEKLDSWMDIFRRLEQGQADPEEDPDKLRRLAIKSIMSQCLIMMTNDFTLEKMRTSARRTAALIIDLKLRHTLGGEGGSNIIIGGEDDEPAPNEPGGGNVLVFKGDKGCQT
jgi:DNA-binding transcriptional ArsR family regulator